MNWCIVYLDDIIIFSDTKEEHLKRLEAVFQKLCAAGLKLKPSKCFFFREEIEYLGHVVSGKGISTNPKKIEAVSKWPTPKTVYDVRSFLGFVGYYRRFIKNFSRITKPIREVITGLENQSKRTAKKTYIEWTDAADTAFEHLKAMCVSTPILVYPDYQLPFTLHTDSSTDGLGAVLYQKQDGKLRVIAYASRSVSKAESNYPAHKLEFLALKWAVCEKFHEYLYGSKSFEVFTDNNPLTYVLTSAKLDACGQRWVTKLANYNFSIRYRCGVSNTEADALSRIKWPEALSKNVDIDNGCMDTHVINAILTGAVTKSSLIESVSCSAKVIPTELDKDTGKLSSINWAKEQRLDPNLGVIIRLIESGQLTKRKLQGKDSSEIKSFLRNKKSLKLVKDVLYRKSFSDNSTSKKTLWQLVVPKLFRERALLGCHDDVGHQGILRTLSLLRERFYWPGMQEEATQHVLKCSRCLRRKTPPQVAPLQPILVTQPLELVHMDYLSLEPSKENIENVLVITDHFTRYALAYPSKTQTAQATARILWDNFICHYGFPEKFISDQGISLPMGSEDSGSSCSSSSTISALASSTISASVTSSSSCSWEISSSWWASSSCIWQSSMMFSYLVMDLSIVSREVCRVLNRCSISQLDGALVITCMASDVASNSVRRLVRHLLYFCREEATSVHLFSTCHRFSLRTWVTTSSNCSSQVVPGSRK